jgi:hypothetical protein
LDWLAHLVGLLSAGVTHLLPSVQAYGGVALVAILLAPILIAASTRQVIPALAAAVLSLASLMLFIAPGSAISTIAASCALGSFLAALHSVVARRRTIALRRQIADLAGLLGQMENAENRRLLSELRKKHSTVESAPGPRDGTNEGGHL